MKIKCKIHKSRATVLLAAADENLIGKTLKGQLNEFYVNPRFYDGDLIDKETLKQRIKFCSAGNLIGKNAVAAAIELGIVNEKNIVYIGKEPHAQFVIMKDM